MINIQNLTTEVLIKIFSYLRVKELFRLRETCKRFHEIIDTWAVSLLPDIRLYVTKQDHYKLINRSLRKLSSWDKLRVSHNWRTGRYKESNLFYSKKLYMSWLHLQNDFLWTSRGNQILGYRRNKYGLNIKRGPCRIRPRSTSDVYRFALKNNHILAGQEDGSLFMWSINKQDYIFDLQGCHEADVAACDLCNDILVSGDHNKIVKVWQLIEWQPKITHCFEACDRICAISVCDENKSLMGIGTCGIMSKKIMSIHDTNTADVLFEFESEQFYAGILDLKWESPQILWSCGYDQMLSKWDFRSGQLVQSFSDPMASSVYCFHTDYGNSIITGTNTNGRAVLWDQRMKNKYIQLYYLKPCKVANKSSPIYCLSFDAEFLFANTDRHVNVLHFNSYQGVHNDYSDCFRY